LTTKFTRHTATSRSPGNSPLRSPVIFVIPSEARNLLSFRPARTRPCHHTPLKLYGPLWLLIAHTRLLNAMRTSSFSQALIKIYNALYFAQSIQLSNIVLISFRFSARLIYPASAGMGLAQFGVCKPLTSSNPMFGARRLSLNRYRIGCRIDAQHYVGRSTSVSVEIQH
jgi:hypothetical protein